jgi:hypothetical protein
VAPALALGRSGLRFCADGGTAAAESKTADEDGSAAAGASFADLDIARRVCALQPQLLPQALPGQPPSSALDPAALVSVDPLTLRLTPPPLPPLSLARSAEAAGGGAAHTGADAADGSAACSGSSVALVPYSGAALSPPLPEALFSAGRLAMTAASAAAGGSGAAGTTGLALSLAGGMPHLSTGTLRPLHAHPAAATTLPDPRLAALGGAWAGSCAAYLTTVSGALQALRVLEVNSGSRAAALGARLRCYMRRPLAPLQALAEGYLAQHNALLPAAASAGGAGAGEARLGFGAGAGAAAASELDAALRASAPAAAGAGATVADPAAADSTAAAGSAVSGGGGGRAGVSDVCLELSTRLQEVAGLMWDAVDAREAANGAALAAAASGGWVLHVQSAVATAYVALAQAETTRFIAARQLLSSYYALAAGGLAVDTPAAACYGGAVQAAAAACGAAVAAAAAARVGSADGASEAAAAPSTSAGTSPAAASGPALGRASQSSQGVSTARGSGGKGAAMAEAAAAAAAAGGGGGPQLSVYAAAVPALLDSVYADGCDTAALRASLQAVDALVAGGGVGKQGAPAFALLANPAAGSPAASAAGPTPATAGGGSGATPSTSGRSSLVAASGPQQAAPQGQAMLQPSEGLVPLLTDTTTAAGGLGAASAAVAAASRGLLVGAGEALLPALSGLSATATAASAAAAGAGHSEGAAAGVAGVAGAQGTPSSRGATPAGAAPAAAAPATAAAGAAAGKGALAAGAPASLTDAPAGATAASAAAAAGLAALPGFALPLDPHTAQLLASTPALAPLLAAIHRGFALADAVAASNEARAVLQARTRARALAAERVGYAAVVAAARCEAVAAAAKAEAEAAEAAAKATKGGGKAAAAAAAGKAGVAAANTAAAAEAPGAGASLTSRGSVEDAGTAGAGAPALSPHTLEGAVALLAAAEANGGPFAAALGASSSSAAAASVRSEDALLSAPLSALAAGGAAPAAGPVGPATGAAGAAALSPALPLQALLPCVDEGCFVALRWEVAQYRARLLALLRHAVASLHRVAAVSAAALTRLSREVSATALAEGACVEAFAQLCGEALARPAPGPLALSVTFGYTRGDEEGGNEGEASDGAAAGSGSDGAWHGQARGGAAAAAAMHASWVIDPSSSSSAGAAAGGSLSVSPAFTSTSATAHAGPVLLIQALAGDAGRPAALLVPPQQHSIADVDASAVDAAAVPDALAASLAAEARPTNAALLAAIDAAVAEATGSGEGAVAAAAAAKARALRVLQATLPLLAPSSLLALSRTLTSAALRHGYATSPAESPAAASASASASGAARYAPSALPLRVALAEVQQLAVSGALQPLPAAAALAHTASLRALLLLHALPRLIGPTSGDGGAAEGKDDGDGEEEEEEEDASSAGAAGPTAGAGAGAAATARDGELCIDWRRLLLTLLMGGPGQPALRPLLQRALADAGAAEAGPAEGGGLTPRTRRGAAAAAAAAAERVLLAVPDGSAVPAGAPVPGIAAPPSPQDLRRLLDALLACSSACAAAGLLPQAQALGPALDSRTLVPLHAAVTHVPLWFSAAAGAGGMTAAGSTTASNGKPSMPQEDGTPARAAGRRYQPPPSPAAAAAACLPLPGSRRNSLSLLEPVTLAVPPQGADPLPAPADVAAVAGAGALAQELTLASALRQGSVSRSRAAAASGERQIAEALMLPFAVAVQQAPAQPLDGHGLGHRLDAPTSAAGEAFFVDVDELCDALQAAADSGL